MPYQMLKSVGRLRDYARLVVGDAHGADGIVTATLQTLDCQQGDTVLGSAPERLFATFSALLNAAATPPAHHPCASLKTQALLLASLEQFDHRQIARILDLAEAEVPRLQVDACRDLAASVPNGILIIEDEPLIATALEDMLDDLGLRVAGSARSHAEAMDVGRRHPPDLILADIVLVGGESGVDAVNQLVAEHPVPVIFTTGYPEEVLSARLPQPVTVLSKPFGLVTVAVAIGRALLLQDAARPSAPASAAPRG